MAPWDIGLEPFSSLCYNTLALLRIEQGEEQLSAVYPSGGGGSVKWTLGD